MNIALGLIIVVLIITIINIKKRNDFIVNNLNTEIDDLKSNLDVYKKTIEFYKNEMKKYINELKSYKNGRDKKS